MQIRPNMQIAGVPSNILMVEYYESLLKHRRQKNIKKVSCVFPSHHSSSYISKTLKSAFVYLFNCEIYDLSMFQALHFQVLFLRIKKNGLELLHLECRYNDIMPLDHHHGGTLFRRKVLPKGHTFG